MIIEWQPIKNALHDIYEEQDILDYFNEDEKYLKNAFEITEQLWEEQFHKINTLKAIIISESPLFRDNQTYIYNINSRPSSFFYFQDLQAFPTYHEIATIPNNPVEKKKIMLEHFSINGFLILDIFPFALNHNITAINYRNMGVELYKNLLDVTAESYLKPKLKLCLEKSQNSTLFIIASAPKVVQTVVNAVKNFFSSWW